MGVVCLGGEAFFFGFGQADVDGDELVGVGEMAGAG